MTRSLKENKMKGSEGGTGNHAGVEEAAKKVPQLMARPLREGGGGGKGQAPKEKNLV